MRCIGLTFSLLLTAAVSLAQHRDTGSLRGKKVLGGSLGYTNSRDNGKSELHSTAAPLFGYFLYSDLMLGSKLEYQYYRMRQTTQGQPVKSHKHITVVNPFARKYFKLGYRLYPYLEGDIKLGWASDQVPTGQREHHFAWGINLRPGMHFMLTQSLAIDFTLGRFGYEDFGRNMRKTYFGLKLDGPELGILFFL